MEIEKIIKSNYLGVLNQDKDFYALIGASLILFNFMYSFLVLFLKKIDSGVDEEKLLRNEAGKIIGNITSVYRDKDFPDIGERYKKLVRDRNKIIHSYIHKIDNKILYIYNLKDGESGSLNKKFFINFIGDCNLTLASIQMMDDEFKKEYKLSKERK